MQTIHTTLSSVSSSPIEMYLFCSLKKEKGLEVMAEERV